MVKPLSPQKKGFVMAMAQLVESHLIKSGISRTKTELPHGTPKRRKQVLPEVGSSKDWFLCRAAAVGHALLKQGEGERVLL